MSEHEELAARFRRHLTGDADEAERQELERAVLEDDELFEQLSEIESELIDAYVEGELDEDITRGLASLVGASPRLQSRAETTLALSQRPSRNSSLPPANEPVAAKAKMSSPSHIARVGALFVLAIIAWLFFQAKALRTEVRTLRAEKIELTERAAALEATVSELEVSNRTLSRRLARIEAERTRNDM